MRELISTVFEIVGLVLVAAAIGVYLWRFDPAIALVGASGALLVESAIVQALGPKPRGEDA